MQTNATPDSTDVMPVPQAPARSILWLLGERSMKAVGGVGIGVAIARHLGPDDYGRYGAAIGLATLGKELVGLGIDRIVRRDLAAEPNRSNEIIGTSLGLATMVAFLAGIGLSLFAMHAIADPVTRRIAMIVIWMAVPQAFFSTELWFESRCDTRSLVWTRNAVWLASVAGRVVLLMKDAPVQSFAIFALGEWVCTYAAVWWLFCRVHGAPKLGFATPRVKAWMKEGWPALVMIAIGATADRMMVLLVQNLATTEQAGYLNAALRITEIWWSFSAIIASVLMARLVVVRRDAPNKFVQAMHDYADVSFLFALAAALGVSLFAPLVIPRLFGAVYGPSAPVLVILCWAGPAIFIGVVRTQRFVLEGKLLLDLPVVITIAGATILLSLLLVPRYGAIGAACAMASAQWIGIFGTALCVPALRRATADLWRSFGAPLRTVAVVTRVLNFTFGRKNGPDRT